MEDVLVSLSDYWTSLRSWLAGMDVQDLLRQFGYLVIVVWTFFEGETIIIVAGAAVALGNLDMDIHLIALSALIGSFAGDQFYFAIGRRYGTPLLEKWPHHTKRLDWAFNMLRKWETLFILSFRFIYGIRNVSPFVIGMSGISPFKFLALNFIAASLWAASFAYGGYYLGTAMEEYLGEHKSTVLFTVLGLIATFGVVSYIRSQRKVKEARLAHSGEPTHSEHISPKEPSNGIEKDR